MTQEHAPIKVLFIDFAGSHEPTTAAYVAKDHRVSANRFLYWVARAPRAQAILVVGSDDPRLSNHESLRAAMRRRVRTRGRQLTGAGVMHAGEVALWDSLDLEVQTPEPLRPLILKALGIE